MRTSALALATVIALAGATLVGAEGPSTALDPLAETRRIEAEIEKLGKTEAGKAFAAIDKRYQEISDREQAWRDAIEKDRTALQESAAGKAHIARIRELEASRRGTWEIERERIATAAKELYAARHAELRKLAAGELPEARKLGLDPLSYPTVDGSTSAHPLGVILACRVLGVDYAWAYPEPNGYPYGVRARIPESLYMTPDMMPAMGGGFDPTDMEFYLAASRTYAKPAKPGQLRTAKLINSDLAQTTTTHEAYKNLINGVCDLNLTAREPSEDELKLAREKGVKIALAPIARDALVFIVNRRNPAKGLSRRQIIDIYEHKTTDWKEAGWPTPEAAREKILPLWRERNSGSRELFDALVMKGRPAPDEKRISRLYSSGMGGPFSRATVEPNVLAHSVYYYEHFMAASAFTRTIAIDGVEPTYESIASGKYPLTSPVYAAYREGSPKDSPAMKLLAWIQSDEGQGVVRESGYVPFKAAK